MMEGIILALFLGLIPAFIAKNKGRSFGVWYVYGALLFIVALIHSLLISKRPENKSEADLKEEGLKKCPYCAEYIKAEAKVCRFCGKDLE